LPDKFFDTWARSCFYAFLLSNKKEMHIFMTVPIFPEFIIDPLFSAKI